MPDDGLHPGTVDRKRIEERVNAVKSRIEREIKALLLCIHGLQADQCGICLGKTEFGAMMEEVLDALRNQGLLEVELAVELRGERRKPVRHQRRLSTLVGLGIGASFFIALIGWQGGKLIWRLIEKDGAKKS